MAEDDLLEEGLAADTAAKSDFLTRLHEATVPYMEAKQAMLQAPAEGDDMAQAANVLAVAEADAFHLVAGSVKERRAAARAAFRAAGPRGRAAGAAPY